ncbi:transmembrane protein 261 [Stegastes partitus]|uniref:Distal membrane arm assembly complex 1 n=1 Tax=Stegastes partitus TaxID=144197 RepID=A0A3B4ZGF6_9TELE|nr:PREDICTED: transmembrane protein 261 [Stegastes partitus]
MSAAPEVPAAKPRQMFNGCWSCRLLSGGGLCLSGAYVFQQAWKAMPKRGGTPMGTVLQMAFATSVASWGLVVLFDPVGNAQRKT